MRMLMLIKMLCFICSLLSFWFLSATLAGRLRVQACIIVFVALLRLTSSEISQAYHIQPGPHTFVALFRRYWIHSCAVSAGGHRYWMFCFAHTLTVHDHSIQDFRIFSNYISTVFLLRLQHDSKWLCLSSFSVAATVKNWSARMHYAIKHESHQRNKRFCRFCWISVNCERQQVLLLMEEILHHLGCIKTCI